MKDDYWSEENQAKRSEKLNHLNSIQLQITELQKEYNKLVDEYDLEYYDRKYIIYSLVDSIPYGWSTDGPTDIGSIADILEESPGWLSSSGRCF